MATRAFASVAAALLLSLALAPPVWSQEGPVAERVARLIDRLGDPDFDTRESATRELREIGAPAVDALRRAAASDDPERAWRAKRVLAEVEADLGRRKQVQPEREGPRSRGTEEPGPPPGPFGGAPRGPGLEDMGRGLEELGRGLERAMQGGLFEGLEDLADDTDPSRQLEGARKILDWVVESQLEGIDDPEARGQVESMKRMMDLAVRGMQALEGLEDFEGFEEPEPEPAPVRPEPEARWGGLSGSRVEAGLRAQLDVPADRGLLVTEVEPGSVAAGLGLERWDLVLAADGRAIATVDDFRRLVEATPAGNTIRFEVVRRGQRREVEGKR